MLRSLFIKAYRRLFHHHGHGVHSPFAYEMIRGIIEERYPYYWYDEIESMRYQMLRRGGGEKGMPFKHGALLLRLVNRFQPARIVEFGSQRGISTCYMYAGNPSTHIASFVSNGANAKHLMQGCEQVEIIAADAPAKVFAQRAEQLAPIDFAVIGKALPVSEWKPLMAAIAPRLNANAVVVIEGIQSDKARRAAWRDLCDDPATQVSMDLYSLGLLFRNPKLNKQHYIVSF